MKKYFIIAICSFFCMHRASGQTLFTYGNEKITVQEFLKAYNKNNPKAGSNKNPKEIQEYLDLYIASRLKIKEAKARGYDTLQRLVDDLRNLRSQIVPAYLNDEKSIEKLVEEAFARSQKDIRLQHIFIAIGEKEDTVAARQKAEEAYKKIQKGQNFSTVAKNFSSDPSVKDNGGDIGYITVFTLPYELENLAYTTLVSKLSSLYKSKSGYHIFKNVNERKALGKIKAAQILIAIPTDAANSSKTEAKKLVDSLYNRLQKGDDFGKLATAFSNDIFSSSANGQMQDVEVGQYNPKFESAAFILPVNGAISKPFLTTHGWHIIKRIDRVPVSVKKDDETIKVLREKVEASDRMNTAKAALIKKVMVQAGYKKLNHNDPDFVKTSDSILTNNVNIDSGTLTSQTPLFQLKEKQFKFQDWIAYARMNRFKNDGTGVKSYDVLRDEFLATSVLEYYKENLESFNPEFKSQINEFSEGNLFFDIMQLEVWGPAQSDTMALENYYKQHQSKYVWNKSADAVIFYTSDEPTANTLRNRLNKSPRWKAMADEYGEKIVVDSARFEISQIPNGNKMVLKNGVMTPSLVNNSDNTASFAYIIKYYPQNEKRNFSEAKGLVINDYQLELEKKWLEELKKKYPVVINEKAWNDLLRSLKI